VSDSEPRTQRRTLGILFLIVFVDLVGFGMIIPVLPLYAKAYEPGPFLFGLLMASYSLMQFLFSPVLGRLSDRFGRRPVLLLSLIGAAVGYGLLAIADTLALLLASRVIAGIFAGNISAAQAVIADTTGPEGRARGMGILGAAFGLGFIAGPALGALLDWIAPWMPGATAATTSLIACGLTWLFLPETRWTSRAPAPAPLGIEALARRVSVRQPALLLCLALVLLLIVAFSAFEVTFAQYLDEAYGFDKPRIYLLFTYAGLLAALVQGGAVGPLARRIGEARLVALGSALSAVALGALPLVDSVPALLTLLAVLALGQGVTAPSLSSLTSRLVEHDRVGGVLGIYQSMSSLGRIIGPFVGQFALGGLGLAWPYWIAAGLDVVAAICAAILVVLVPARAATAQS
jgi:MFS family permease